MFRFHGVRVLRTIRVSRFMVRVTFIGGGFASGGRDQRVKLFLPHRDQPAPVVPGDSADWYSRWREMDPGVRAVMRTYTVRSQRGEEFDIDFGVDHAGAASGWAAAANPGDRAVVLGPSEPDNQGVDFRPPTGTEWVLLAGDSSALPAIGGILSWLPPELPVRCWVTDDGYPLPARVVCGASLTDAVRAAEFPPGQPYAWIAGEAAEIRDLRRHLVGERGFPREAVTFTGYWRRGVTEDGLLASPGGLVKVT